MNSTQDAWSVSLYTSGTGTPRFGISRELAISLGTAADIPPALYTVQWPGAGNVDASSGFYERKERTRPSAPHHRSNKNMTIRTYNRSPSPKLAVIGGDGSGTCLLPPH